MNCNTFKFYNRTCFQAINIHMNEVSNWIESIYWGVELSYTIYENNKHETESVMPELKQIYTMIWRENLAFLFGQIV